MRSVVEKIIFHIGQIAFRFAAIVVATELVPGEMRFTYLFPRVALAVSVLALALEIAVAVSMTMASNYPVNLMAGHGALLNWVVVHAVLFCWILACFLAVALVASLGFLRHRIWAHRAWIVLVAVMIAWTLLAVGTELVAVCFNGTGDLSWPRLAPKIAWIVMLVVEGLLVLVTCFLLLRKLSSASTRQFFSQR